MNGNPEFDKALKDTLGEECFKSLFCKECNAELIECPHCHEMICPEGCDNK